MLDRDGGNSAPPEDVRIRSDVGDDVGSGRDRHRQNGAKTIGGRMVQTVRRGALQRRK